MTTLPGAAPAGPEAATRAPDHFARAHELHAAGVPFATAVVVRAEKPTSGRPADRAIVTVDGRMEGWIGGSCAQPTVVREGLRALAEGTSRLIRLSPEPGARPVPEGVEEVEMTCFSGGTLDVFIEPHQPPPRLLIFGHQPVARGLARLGRAVGYHVIGIDPSGRDPLTDADVVLGSLDEVAAHVTPLTFAVVATHGEYDEAALRSVLGRGAAYIGLVASRKRGAQVLELVEAEGGDAEELAEVKYPAGLDLGAERGEEIAVSILAEVVQVRRSLGPITWAEATPAAEEAAAPADSAVATDPICGMAVTMQGADHTYEHDGRTYYFCCAGCRRRFAEDPVRYAPAV